MEFRPAQLDRLALAKLQEFEQEFRKQTSEEIVVVAYRSSGEASQGMQTAGNGE